MSNSKKMLSLLMAVIMFILSAISSTAIIAPEDSASVQVEWMYKIDNVLLEMLDDLENNEKVTVSIWFDDVDKEQVKNKLNKECNATRTINAYSKAEELLFNEMCDLPVGYSGDYLSYAIDYYKDVTQDDFQYISEKKRELFRSEYQIHNQNMINQLSSVFGNENIEVSYVSKYAPNIEIELTKENILKVSQLEIVNEIYLVNTNYEISTANDNDSTEVTDDSESVLDNTYFHVTGLDIGRDIYELNGAGMKVGVIEWTDKLYKEKLNNNNITILNQGYAASDSHAALVCGLLVS